MSLIYDVDFNSGTRVLSLLDKAGNVISSCEVPSKSNELTLTATVDNSSVKLTKNGTLSNTYEVNVGSGWTAYKFGTVIPLNAGESCKWRCSSHSTTQSPSTYVKFVMSGRIEASGNCNSMLSSDFENITSLSGYNSAFCNLFTGCTVLTRAPELPATTLAYNCYDHMFSGCSALTQAPQLPATTLANYCYDHMFSGCSALTQAPQLPATTLAYNCYDHMFSGCSALTQAPQLPATTLANYCYKNMFENCSVLAEVRIAATTTATDALNNWLAGVPRSGDFYCNYSSRFPSGSSGIPVGWARWLYGVSETGTTTMYHNGVAKPVRTGITNYDQKTCISVQGWAGFKTIEQVYYLGYTFGVQVVLTMYYKGASTTIVKTEANNLDNFTEDMYFLNGVYKTLSEMHVLGYTLGAQTPITMYGYEDPISAYSCASNADDGFAETMYDVDDEMGYQTIAQQNEKGVYLTITTYGGLTLTATADNSSVSVSFITLTTKPGVHSVEVHTGRGWRHLALDSDVIRLNIGDKCRCRAFSKNSLYDYIKFNIEGAVEASGNVHSMIDKNFINTSTVTEYGYAHLFQNCTGLTQAPELPATTLANDCYSEMFYGCTGLTQAPELPVTTLANGCYRAMFQNCTGLTQAPELPATTLAYNCYSEMFYGCTGLTQAPELPVTTLAYNCYRAMFQNCTGLTQAPELPATTLDISCYQAMFKSCTGLTQAPELPATTLANTCYSEMFYGCTGLTQAPVLPATTLANYCYKNMFENCSVLAEVRISATKTATDALNNWLSGVSATGDFYCDPNATIFLTDSASGIPKGWNRRNIDLLNALTLTATADNSSVKLTKNGTLDNTFEVDTGNGWTAYEFDTVIPLNAGQSCKWRCKSHTTTQSDSNYVQFVMTGKIEASGNVNSMLSRGFENLTSLSGYDYAFNELFKGCTSLTQAPSLPATNLETNCYYSMFKGCTSLTKAPSLPSTALASNCYVFMFYGCTSLTQAPSLPATTLANYCYRYMFEGCTSLTQAPSLPATTLANFCYEYMFKGCTSLTQAPSLPATALASNCYAFMFYGCTSLVQAPSLPATTLANFCYEYMFTGCTPLNEVRISATTTATGALDYWLSGVSATGDFYCDPNATIFLTDSASGIPANWNRHALADYPATP